MKSDHIKSCTMYWTHNSVSRDRFKLHLKKLKKIVWIEIFFQMHSLAGSRKISRKKYFSSPDLSQDKLFWIVQNNSFIFTRSTFIVLTLIFGLTTDGTHHLKTQKTRFHKMSWNMKNLHVSWHFRPFLKNTINSIVLVSIVSNQCFSSKFGGSENQ